jgi:hypothetical protein
MERGGKHAFSDGVVTTYLLWLGEVTHAFPMGIFHGLAYITRVWPGLLKTTLLVLFLWPHARGFVRISHTINQGSEDLQYTEHSSTTGINEQHSSTGRYHSLYQSAPRPEYLADYQEYIVMPSHICGSLIQGTWQWTPCCMGDFQTPRGMTGRQRLKSC